MSVVPMKGDASRRQPRLLPRLGGGEEAYAVLATLLALTRGIPLAALPVYVSVLAIVAGAHPD